MNLDQNASGFKVWPYNKMCDMCQEGAIIRMRGGHVCYRHYMELHQKDADRYCAERGLDTTEKKIAHCRKLLGLFIEKQKKVLEREPGSDDE
jgi:hypothetical protein